MLSFLSLAISSPALLNASKTLLALSLHRACRDPRLLPAASGYYTKALRHAQVEATSTEKDPVRAIGSAHLLLICELFQGVSFDDTREKKPHARLIITFVERYRGDQSNLGMQRLRKSPVPLVAAWELLIARKNPCREAVPPPESELSDGSISSMSDLTILTATVLEDCDTHLMAKRSVSSPLILHTLQRIVSLQGVLHDWMTNYLKSLNGSPFWLIDAGDLPCPAGGATRLLHPHVYAFASTAARAACIGYWTCHLALSDAQAEIVKAHELAMDVDPSALARIKSLSEEYASHISRSMQSVRTPRGPCGPLTMTTGPFHLLILYYERHKNWQLVSWCVECARYLGIPVDRLSESLNRLAVKGKRRVSRASCKPSRDVSRRARTPKTLDTMKVASSTSGRLPQQVSIQMVAGDSSA